MIVKNNGGVTREEVSAIKDLYTSLKQIKFSVNTIEAQKTLSIAIEKKKADISKNNINPKYVGVYTKHTYIPNNFQ
jgi:hypothetical protein